MDMPNIQFGELLEKGQSAASDAAKTAVSDVVGSASGQIGIKNEANATQVQNQIQQQGQPQEQISTPSQSQTNNEFTNEMVKEFYAPSSGTPQYSLAEQNQPIEEQKLAQIRQKLHQEQHNEVYFNAVLNADAPKKQQEERPAERVERQEMEDLQDQRKKQEDLPTAVTRAQTHTEVSPGIAG